MSARIGIELAPSVCRIVELDAPLGRARHGIAAPRVRSFSVIPSSDRELLDAFRSLARRRASVVVWGAPSDHRQVVVADGSYDRMRAEALKTFRGGEEPVKGRLSAIAPAGPPVPGSRRRAVLLASADGPSFEAALAPLVSAGIRIEAALTPAAALLSLARLRRTIDGAESSTGDEVFVALEESIARAALVRGGSMLAARMMPWGFVDQSTGRRLLRPRQEIAMRLAGDLSEFVSAARLDLGGVSQISVCGPLPDLRSMAALLVERMDIEVEPLDTLFGIDPSGGSSGDQLSEKIAELRLAWAAAADERPALDLYRSRHGRTARTNLSRAAVAAGLVAGLGGGWLVQSRWGPIAPRPRPAAVPPAPAERPSARRPTFVPERPAPPPSAVAATLSPAVALTLPEPVPPPPANVAVVPASGVSVALPIAVEPEPVPAVEPPPAPRPAAPPRPRAPEAALPFDASLQTILFGPERRLAIVDGRIVGEGDEIKGARVVEITQNAVLLRDGQGRLRRLTGAPR